jgi:hypothetical protein
VENVGGAVIPSEDLFRDKNQEMYLAGNTS